MVDKTELEEDFVGALRFSPVSIISSMFHTQSIHLFIHSSFIHSFFLSFFLSFIGHQHCVILYGVSDIRPISAFAIQTHKLLNANEVLQPNTKFNTCHTLLHISV